MIELKNALNKNLFRKIKEEVESDRTPWFFRTTAYNDGSNEKDISNWSYSHLVIDDGEHISYLAPYFESAILEILDKLNVSYEKILRVRIGCITVMPKQYTNLPHIDWKFEHQTGLLYLNEADGDTILYNKSWNGEDFTDTDQVKKLNLKEETRITPEENKFILFNGLQYHSSSTPTNTFRRIVVNFNII